MIIDYWLCSLLDLMLYIALLNWSTSCLLLLFAVHTSYIVTWHPEVLNIMQ